MEPAGAPTLEQLCTLPMTGSTVASLAGYEPSELSDADLVRYMRACQRAESHFAGRRLQAVARLAQGVEGDGETVQQAATVAEVGVALRLAPRSAVNEIHRARRLSSELSNVLAGIVRGDLTYRHGLAMLDATATVDDRDVLDEAQRHVLPRAATKSPAELARAAKRVIAVLDPQALQRRHDRARQSADVTLQPVEDAMAYLTAYLPLPDAASVHAAVDASARTAKASGDPRPLGMLRAAALVDACTGALSSPARSATTHRLPVEIHVTATPDVLLGLSDAPGEIPGVGPVPGSLIRQMACDAKLRWLTIDGETGRLLDYGRQTYRVPAPVAAQVLATWVTSAGPHSTVSAGRSDLDHVVPYPAGPTSPDNLVPVDRRWHRAKTLHGVRATRQPGGSVRWTTPLGQAVTVEPFDYRLCESDP